MAQRRFLSPVGLHVAVLHHVPLQVAGLREGLVAHLTLVGPHALVREQVGVQMAQLLEQLPAQVAAVGLDATMAQYVRDQVVLGGVRLLAHAALPPLLVPAHVHVVAVVHLDVEAQLLCAGRAPSTRASVWASATRFEGLLGVHGSRGEVHDGPRQEERKGQQAGVERGEVWGRGMEEERRRVPYWRGRRQGLLLHLNRWGRTARAAPGQATLELQSVEVDHARDGFLADGWRSKGKGSMG